MKKNKLLEIAMISFCIVTISALGNQLLDGAFFIFTTCGFIIYSLVISYVLQTATNNEKQAIEKNNLGLIPAPPAPKETIDFLKLSSAYERSSFATFFTDSNFRILWHNRFAEINLDLQKLNSTEANFKTLVDAEAIEKLNEVVKINNIQTIIPPLELKLRGQAKTILLHINRIIQNNEQYFILNVIDITDHKALEVNFIHSQKMQALGQLSGSIAHDFNNLLTAIIGFSDLLLIRHQIGDPSFPELMQIKQNGNRAANLVRQLLAFSRKQVMQSTLVNITDTIAELAHLLKRLVGNNISLNIDHGNDLSGVTVNQGQLEQVITNLVVNARDAMPNGGELFIKTKNIIVDESFKADEYYTPTGSSPILPGNYALISITDTGTGINEDILTKIFEPFFSTKDPGSGTGLGLATVNGITEQFGGHIRLKTIVGKGTTFYIFLKAADIKTIDAPTIEERSESTMIYETPPKGKILIAEDEASIRMFSVHALKSKGFEVLEAASGEEAVEIIKEQGDSIDVLITDVMMKGMDGTELVEKIKLEYPNLKVLFMSGYAQDAISYLNNSGHKFLSKPYTLQELVTTINELLKQNEAVT